MKDKTTKARKRPKTVRRRQPDEVPVAPFTKQDVANGFAKGTGGRPRIWDDPDEMQQTIDAYFDEPGQKSVYELVRVLGFESRSSMDDYIARGDVFSEIIKRARNRVMEYYDKIGQDRQANGHFCSTMLDRMGEVVVQKQEVQVQAVSMLDAAAIVAGELPPAERRALPVESREVEAAEA